MKRIGCDEMARVAREHLIETDNPAVMYGDIALLHQIAERAGLPNEGAKTEQRVLNLLSYYCRNRAEKGRLFDESWSRTGFCNRPVRVFRLRESQDGPQ